MSQPGDGQDSSAHSPESSPALLFVFDPVRVRQPIVTNTKGINRTIVLSLFFVVLYLARDFVVLESQRLRLSLVLLVHAFVYYSATAFSTLFTVPSFLH